MRDRCSLSLERTCLFKHALRTEIDHRQHALNSSIFQAEVCAVLFVWCISYACVVLYVRQPTPQCFCCCYRHNGASALGHHVPLSHAAIGVQKCCVLLSNCVLQCYRASAVLGLYLHPQCGQFEFERVKFALVRPSKLSWESHRLIRSQTDCFVSDKEKRRFIKISGQCFTMSCCDKQCHSAAHSNHNNESDCSEVCTEKEIRGVAQQSLLGHWSEQCTMTFWTDQTNGQTAILF